jgi:hypothetical protein
MKPGLFKHVIHNGRAIIISGNIRNAIGSKFFGNIGCSLLVSEEKDLTFGFKQGPALDGVSLDDAHTAMERLRDGKECDH